MYAAAFSNSVTGAVSPVGEAVPGAGDDALQILSIDDLKGRYLFGLNLADPYGNEMPDQLYQFWISAAVSNLEKRLDIRIRPTVVQGELHDWVRPQSAVRPLQLRTNMVPVQTVQAVRLRLPYTREGVAYPTESVRLRPTTGRITVYPVGSMMFPYADWGSAWGNCAWDGDSIPDSWSVDYVAGFAAGRVPPEIVEVIGKLASYGPLNIAGDLIGGAGIASQSLSIDGLSQSINTTSSPMYSGYGARLSIYQREIGEMIPLLRKTYRGTPLLGG